MAGRCLQVIRTVVVVVPVATVALVAAIPPAMEASSGAAVLEGVRATWEPVTLSLSMSAAERLSLPSLFLDGLAFFDKEPMRWSLVLNVDFRQMQAYDL